MITYILPWGNLGEPVQQAACAVGILQSKQTEAFIPVIFMCWIIGN